MLKFNSSYLKYSLIKPAYLQFTFNKFSFKNFYFQQPGKHGAGDVSIILI